MSAVAMLSSSSPPGIMSAILAAQRATKERREREIELADAYAAHDRDEAERVRIALGIALSNERRAHEELGKLVAETHR